MADKILLDMNQIKEIYRAGIRRGNDEATAFEWGARASGDELVELVDALYTIENEGKSFDDPDYLSYDKVRLIVEE